MPRTIDILLTALAPAVWGSTYIVTTELLPAGYPLSVAVLRGLDGAPRPLPASPSCFLEMPPRIDRRQRVSSRPVTL